MSLPDTIISRERKRRAGIASESMAGRYRTAPLTHEQRETMVRLLSDGATVIACIEAGIIPSNAAFCAERERDPDYARRVDEAKVMGLSLLLSLAQEHVSAEVEHGDPDRARAAATLMTVTQAYVEKMAPKDFGALVKLAGSDGGALTINVVDYSKPLDGGVLLETKANSRVRGSNEYGSIDEVAEYTPIAPPASAPDAF